MPGMSGFDVLRELRRSSHIPVLMLTALASRREVVVSRGQQVFMISWRNPTSEQRDWNVDTYAAAAKDPDDWATFERRFLSGSEQDYQDAVAVFAQEQFTPEFLRLNPLGKVPVNLLSRSPNSVIFRKVEYSEGIVPVKLFKPIPKTFILEKVEYSFGKVPFRLL